MRRGNYTLGIILIIIGITILLANFGMIKIDWYKYWPIILLVPGLVFEISYFIGRSNPGVLVPGGILTTYGILFLINILYGWHWMNQLWPLFPLGVAIGLFQLYLFGDREKMLLIPIGILGGFSLLALGFTITFIDLKLISPVILILIGLLIIFKR